MRILLVMAFMGWGANVVASDLTKWNLGILVMADGEVRHGEFAFEVAEIVLFKSKDEVTVLPAHKVQSFRYYDRKENINRKFVSRSSPGGSSFFYEVVVSGEVSVIRKFNQSIISDRVKSDRFDYDYFICLNNNLIPLRKFRHKVYPNLISHSSEVMMLINQHHLNPNTSSDAIQIVQLYNKATSEETLVAGI